jgi:hypothetical protein
VRLLVVTRGAAGAPASRRTVSAEWVRVGRNAASEIFLPDPRVALAQGMLVWRDGLVYLEGEAGTANRSVTQRTVRSVRLHPGTTLDIGPYRLEALAAPAGYDGAVSVELVHPLEALPDLKARASRLTLASLGIAKRPVA